MKLNVLLSLEISLAEKDGRADISAQVTEVSIGTGDARVVPSVDSGELGRQVRQQYLEKLSGFLRSRRTVCRRSLW